MSEACIQVPDTRPNRQYYIGDTHFGWLRKIIDIDIDNVRNYFSALVSRAITEKASICILGDAFDITYCKSADIRREVAYALEPLQRYSQATGNPLYLVPGDHDRTAELQEFAQQYLPGVRIAIQPELDVSRGVIGTHGDTMGMEGFRHLISSVGEHTDASTPVEELLQRVMDEMQTNEPMQASMAADRRQRFVMEWGAKTINLIDRLLVGEHRLRRFTEARTAPAVSRFDESIRENAVQLAERSDDIHVILYGHTHRAKLEQRTITGADGQPRTLVLGNPGSLSNRDEVPHCIVVDHERKTIELLCFNGEGWDVVEKFSLCTPQEMSSPA